VRKDCDRTWSELNGERVSCSVDGITDCKSSYIEKLWVSMIGLGHNKWLAYMYLRNIK